MPNPVVHFEILGPDHQRLQQYYRDLFGWSINAPSAGIPYGLVSPDEGSGGIGGGIGQSMDCETRSTFYVEVDDIHAALARASELGGQTVMPVTVLPGMVSFALFKDIAGNLIGLAASQTPPADASG